MVTDSQIRNQIIRQIQRIPPDKLKELEDFISKLDQNIDKKAKILSFAGAWLNIDDSVFNELTDNLINERQKNKRRFDD